LALEANTQVGRFRVIKLVAQGGMAEVYRAEQEMSAGIYRPAALKVIRPEYAESDDFREMFLDEARTACTLSHPNIVHIYEVGEADGLLYMAMELVRGESVSSVARKMRENGERFSDEAILAIGVFTCSALEAVHALKLAGEGHINLVHRDVSPHNLLLGPSGSLKLIDFGIAKAAHNRNLTSPGITKGKAGYFSPEQAMGKKLDGRSDLFSLGITLYKLACGFTPFDDYKTHQERNQALVHGRWEKLETVCPGLPKGLYEVVDKATRIRPDDRFSDAREMREALEKVALESGMHAGPSSLMGYVEDKEEPPSVRSGSSSARRKAAQAAAPPPKPARHVPLGLIALLGASAVAVAAVGVGLLPKVRSEAEPGKPAPPAVAASEAPAGPGVAPAPDAAVAVSETAAPAANPAPPPAPALGLDVSQPPPVPKSRPRPVASREVSAPRTVIEEVIPDGQGTLRIGSDDDGEIVVAGKRYGITPLNLPMRSGRYVVEIARPGKKPHSSYPVRVMPDRTVRLKYSFADNRWSVE
jgi:serine/threonine-protein kinase